MLFIGEWDSTLFRGLPVPFQKIELLNKSGGMKYAGICGRLICASTEEFSYHLRRMPLEGSGLFMELPAEFTLL